MARGPRAAWRRYRARRFLELGQGIGIVFSTPTAGPVQLTVRFEEQGTTLDMEIYGFYALECLEPGNPGRADVGVGEIMKGLDLVCRRASEAGYLRLHAHGLRSGDKAGLRSIDVNLARRQTRR
jgi:hypothetical protein